MVAPPRARLPMDKGLLSLACFGRAIPAKACRETYFYGLEYREILDAHGAHYPIMLCYLSLDLQMRRTRLPLGPWMAEQ